MERKEIILVTKDIMKKDRITFHYKKYISQISGHTSNTDKLSQKLDKKYYTCHFCFAFRFNSLVFILFCVNCMSSLD